MVLKCSIPGCENKTNPEIPMHSLSKDPVLLMKTFLRLQTKMKKKLISCQLALMSPANFPQPSGIITEEIVASSGTAEELRSASV